jgi:hypothetical protein
MLIRTRFVETKHYHKPLVFDGFGRACNCHHLMKHYKTMCLQEKTLKRKFFVLFCDVSMVYTRFDGFFAALRAISSFLYWYINWFLFDNKGWQQFFGAPLGAWTIIYIYIYIS